jgi:hypothetical protein
MVYLIVGVFSNEQSKCGLHVGHGKDWHELAATFSRSIRSKRNGNNLQEKDIIYLFEKQACVLQSSVNGIKQYRYVLTVAGMEKGLLPHIYIE